MAAPAGPDGGGGGGEEAEQVLPEHLAHFKCELASCLTAALSSEVRQMSAELQECLCSEVRRLLPPPAAGVGRPGDRRRKLPLLAAIGGDDARDGDTEDHGGGRHGEGAPQPPRSGILGTGWSSGGYAVSPRSSPTCRSSPDAAVSSEEASDPAHGASSAGDKAFPPPAPQPGPSVPALPEPVLDVEPPSHLPGSMSSQDDSSIVEMKAGAAGCCAACATSSRLEESPGGYGTEGSTTQAASPSSSRPRTGHRGSTDVDGHGRSSAPLRLWRRPPSAWCWGGETAPCGSRRSHASEHTPRSANIATRLKDELWRQKLKRQTHVPAGALGPESNVGALYAVNTSARSIDNAVMEQGSCMTWTALIVQSDYFDYCVSLLLFVSSLTIGLSVDYEAKHLNAGENPTYRGIELFFCFCFSIELFLRILVSRRAFFRFGPDFYWNMFDTFLVVCQILEEIVTAVFANDVGPKTQVSQAMRVVRVIRIMRVVRMLRLVRFVNELRKLVYLIIASFWSFIWTMVMLGMVTYIVAVFMTSNVTFHQQSLEVADPELHQYFGTVSDSVHSLYQAVAGGIDWGDISTVLIGKLGTQLGIIFILYVSFAVLVLLNLATGVFVDGALRLSRADKEMELVKRVQKAFNFADDDQMGTISLSEFKKAFQEHNQAVVDIFRAIEIKVDRAEDLFMCLDDDGSGEITAQEFIVGALNLQGPAKALDLAMIAQQQRVATREIVDTLSRLAQKLQFEDDVPDIHTRQWNHTLR